MSIIETRAIPYFSMKDYLDGNPLSKIASMAHRFDKIWIVSITNAAKAEAYKTPVLITRDTDDRIALQFDDVEIKYDSYSGLEKELDRTQTYFNEQMADKICRFIHRAHTSNPEGNDLLVVNCHMGISRSGAVSDFVRTTFGLDYGQWKWMNPAANPNKLVLDLLKWKWKELGF